MSFTLINASAGSGKTHRLTHEIAGRIRDGLHPSQLIATTFTRKAASELVDRVHRTLLEQHRFDDAQGIGSALIGTVNSVAGRLVREFALDLGISPDVQELDDVRQRAAFSAAIDEAAAEAGSLASDLLARTEHDGEEDPAFTFGSSPSWRAHVRTLAEKARTNGIDAQQLRGAADAAWQEYREAAGFQGQRLEEGADRRAAWLSGLDTAIRGLKDDLAASEDPAPGAGKPPIAKGSLNSVRKGIDALESLRRTLERRDRAPWSQWAKLAAVTASKAVGGEKGYVYGKDTDTALAGLALQIEAELPSNPQLLADVRSLITLVMSTAATSLDAYARYKDELGLMDFVDQEVLALEVLRRSERARTAVRSRFRLLAVDEFQDTSPIQLALFLALGELIEDLIWVGDPKQAIYSFRDADPDLMLGVLREIRAGSSTLGEGTVDDLKHSWRSQDPVLELVNQVFPQIFPKLPREQVVLTAAPAAAQTRARRGHPEGRLEAWTPQYSGRPSQAKHARGVADGVLALLGDDGVGPEDVAVLVRSNAQAAEVVGALTARGIPASGEGVPLLVSREGRILRAALAVTLDGSDTLALTELVDLLTGHPAHGRWFSALTEAKGDAARQEVFRSWWQADVLAGLRSLREECISLTPIEMITALADALDLPELIRSWSTPDQRLRTLDAVRKVAKEYADQARSVSAPITLTGLRAALDDTARGPDLAGTPGTVWVGTIHGAKGLEWPRVVVMQQDAKEHAATSGVFVVPAEELDVMQPLAGRSLRYWPKVLPRFAPLQERLAGSAHALRSAATDRDEAGRLQYVALTRARDVTVLSGHGSAPVLDALLPEAREEPLLSWEVGAEELRVGPVTLPAVIRGTATETDEDSPSYHSGRSPLAATDLSPQRPVAAGGVSARFQASGVESREKLGEVREPVRIGPRLVPAGGQGWERVGEAVHGYLALPLRSLDAEQRERAARRLVQRWTLERSLGTEALIGAGQAWLDHLDAAFPGAEELTEQPISWWNEEDQVMEGWVDALLRLPTGEIVLVDHKSYPGGDPVGHVRREYLGQMATYARALAAAGRAPDRILMHLPLLGEIVEIELAAHAR
ncbi:MAG: UvrD-helicase domain-containing protein [Brachybacterium sp.]|uniref:UvrD-helicase domain-containing protein n=1 Tax=Brachybacterium sp. TaxID=1891286 RepID=UPI003F8F0EC0